MEQIFLVYSVSLFHKSSCGHPFLNRYGIFYKSTCSRELRICNVFDRYLKSIELIRNSSCSLPFDEWSFFNNKKTIAATHSFKFTMLLQNRSCSKEMSQLLTMMPAWFQECLYWMKSVIWRDLLQPPIFSTIVSLFYESTWSNPNVEETVSISQHL